MRQVKSQAIVLKKKNLLNKNFLITFFTKDFGKINILAFGVKKITSRRISSLQTGNLVEIIFVNKENRLFLKESILKSGFSLIKKNQKKSKYLYLIIFILDRILAENQKEKKIYNLTLKYLINLSKNKPSSKDLIIFINKVMVLLGFSKTTIDKEKLFSYIEELINEKIPSYLRV